MYLYKQILAHSFILTKVKSTFSFGFFSVLFCVSEGFRAARLLVHLNALS